MSEAANRIMSEAMRQARNNAFDACIELCKEFARTGHDAACCVRALTDLKDSMNDVAPQPSKGN